MVTCRSRERGYMNEPRRITHPLRPRSDQLVCWSVQEFCHRGGNAADQNLPPKRPRNLLPKLYRRRRDPEPNVSCGSGEIVSDLHCIHYVAPLGIPATCWLILVFVISLDYPGSGMPPFVAHIFAWMQSVFSLWRKLCMQPECTISQLRCHPGIWLINKITVNFYKIIRCNSNLL